MATPLPKWPPYELEELQLRYPHLAKDLEQIVLNGYGLNPKTVAHLQSRLVEKPTMKQQLIATAGAATALTAIIALLTAAANLAHVISGWLAKLV